ncbi:type II toxin-antitoxin system RelE/ParE family toxin [Enterococcus sp.]|uniref:type II toxin-antitoxin system RelE family toxin n=1 Tax=Enterococcus sp. TaxID=35783 RepID=UPI0028AE9A40|nr:type II toxin-antitoxin system RelE/ParE family toxin [Enterococcus sp.]
MGFKVRYEKEAQKNLKKMDKFQARIIINWIEKNLVECEDPFQHGKGLTADKSGLWRYRVGNYRILADVSSEEITILILKIGHRKEIYQ